ncbi:MAG: hypothetical protein M1833_004610 [Piccolia ochrophora]|nr:MAG: hypothetical protein M1833_004610 [Piccolia ochrophora]
MATRTQSAPVPAHGLSFEPHRLPTLRSNKGKGVDPTSIKWMTPTESDTSMAEMRRRFEEDGYVWVKNLIPRNVVNDMREHYFSCMSDTGILKPGTSPRDGIFNDAEDPMQHTGIGAASLPENTQRLTEAHVTSDYLRFLENLELRGFIRRFMNWEKDVLLARTMLRHAPPHGVSTGIHYDKIFLRGGDADFLTAWVPIGMVDLYWQRALLTEAGDISVNGGGLMYLEGSTEMGKAIEDDFSERALHFSVEEKISAFNANMGHGGQLSDDAEEFGRVEAKSEHMWMVAEYEAGDVVFHNPYFIHGAGMNEDRQGRIRLSTDLRFYEEGAALDERWMKVWTPNDGL